MLCDPCLLGRIPVRAYPDLDPAFVRLWHAPQDIDMRLDGHTHHVTVGLAISETDHPSPTCGVRWIGTPQLVVLEQWPAGVTELGCHPGYGDDLDSVYRAERAEEVRVLCDPRIADAIRRAGIELCSFHDVGQDGERTLP